MLLCYMLQWAGSARKSIQGLALVYSSVGWPHKGWPLYTLPCEAQALMLQSGSLLYFAVRCYTLWSAVYALLRRAALLGTRLCTKLQRAVPTLRTQGDRLRSHGILR